MPRRRAQVQAVQLLRLHRHLAARQVMAQPFLSAAVLRQLRHTVLTRLLTCCLALQSLLRWTKLRARRWWARKAPSPSLLLVQRLHRSWKHGSERRQLTEHLLASLLLELQVRTRPLQCWLLHHRACAAAWR